MQDSFSIQKSNSRIHRQNTLKKKNNMITSIDADKAFDKLQQLFVFKKKKKRTTQWTMNEGDFLQLIRYTYRKLTAHTTLNGEKLEAFPLRWETRQVWVLSLLFFNIVLVVLANIIREKK